MHSSLSIFLVSVAAAQEPLPSVKINPETGDCDIRYEGAEGMVRSTTWVPRSKVAVAVGVLVHRLPSGAFVYEYSLLNSTVSRQNLLSFWVETETTTLVSAAKPDHWVSGSARLEKFQHFWARRRIAHIGRGGTLSGFAISAAAIPGISRTRFTGLAPPLAYSDEPPQEVEDLVDEICHTEDRQYAMGHTLGPLTDPAGLSPTELLARLIEQKHQARTLDWISGPGADGLAKSLDAKLEAAKAAVDRGQPKTAKNDLRAFLNEVEAQKGKALNNEAYLLLKLNAEFILTKL